MRGNRQRGPGGLLGCHPDRRRRGLLRRGGGRHPCTERAVLTWGCISAPYTDVAQFIPGDYLWLIPGILLAPIFVVLKAAIQVSARDPMRIFSRIGLAFAITYAVVIGVDYFVQSRSSYPACRAARPRACRCSPSTTRTGCSSPARRSATCLCAWRSCSQRRCSRAGRIERATCWLFVAGFTLATVAFAGFWLVGGDLVAFEVAVLSINWIVLIASGALLTIVFRRTERSARISSPAPARRINELP